MKIIQKIRKFFRRTETIIPLRLMYPLSLKEGRHIIEISSGVSIFNDERERIMILREGDEVFGLSMGDIYPRRFVLEKVEYSTSYKWFFTDVAFPNRLEIKDFSWIEE